MLLGRSLQSWRYGLATGTEAGSRVLRDHSTVTTQDLTQSREPLPRDTLDPQVAGQVVLPPCDRVGRILLRHDPAREIVRVAVTPEAAVTEFLRARVVRVAQVQRDGARAAGPDVRQRCWWQAAACVPDVFVGLAFVIDRALPSVTRKSVPMDPGQV